jgi:N-acetylmuramoyl-L-alanine amidase
MIILTAGHTGPNTGAQCAETHFDEGAENIWLRNRIAEILTNKYGLVVLIDQDTASLKLLVSELNQTSPPLTSPVAQKSSPLELGGLPEGGGGLLSVSSVLSVGDNHSEGVTSVRSVSSVREKENSVSETTFLIDLHFNAHTNPNARGTEAIVSDDATTLELRFASRLAHTTSDALDIPLRCIKSESQTPHHRLAMLHLTPQSIILEVCFCTSPEDVEAYRKNREKLAAELAWAIAELILDRKT